MPVHVTHRETHGHQILTIGRETISLSETDSLSLGQFFQDMAVNMPPQIVVDLQHVDFFSSSFIEALFRLWNHVRDQPDGTFCLANVQSYCREVLEIVKLDTIWPIYDDIEAATEAA